jgi:hypothetical protein
MNDVAEVVRLPWTQNPERKGVKHQRNSHEFRY